MKQCNSCGKCCVKYGSSGLSASQNEIEYWEVFRPDIAKYINNSNIWVDPKTGKNPEHCPWLTVVCDESGKQLRVTCDIYLDRPEDCIIYPVTIAEMIKDGCEMLEPKDFKNPEQAQKDLDVLMADSRPE